MPLRFSDVSTEPLKKKGSTPYHSAQVPLQIIRTAYHTPCEYHLYEDEVDPFFWAEL